MLLKSFEMDARRAGIAEGIQQGLQQGISQGIEQGIFQGIKQGAYQKARETAKLMKQANCETHFIMQMTKLRKEEIEEL